MEKNTTVISLLPSENTSLEDDATTKAMSHVMYRIGELFGFFCNLALKCITGLTRFIRTRIIRSFI